jgi:uncharacterized protein YndB with AHSA1/START domain
MNNIEPHLSNDIALTITRTFNAPRALVFKMWTDTQHTNRWCCPTGFTIIECNAVFNVGGAYNTIMRSPQNTDHHVSGVYTQIEEGFENDGDKTRLTLVQSPMESETARDMHASGWNETLNNLGPYLAKV